MKILSYKENLQKKQIYKKWKINKKDNLQKHPLHKYIFDFQKWQNRT